MVRVMSPGFQECCHNQVQCTNTEGRVESVRVVTTVAGRLAEVDRHEGDQAKM